MGAVYWIRNILDDKKYIGSSTNLIKRWRKHKTLLRHNRHPNDHLQAAWNKYGAENFEMSILEDDIDNSILRDRERDYIYEFKTLDRTYGYNLREELGGGARRFSEETKAKISKSKQGQRVSEEAKIKMSITRKGKPFSEEHKRKISESNQGRVTSEETKRLLSKANLGKHLSEETKAKISASESGENHYNYGKHRDEGTKLKLTDANCTYRYIVIAPNGDVYAVRNGRDFERTFGLGSGAVSSVAGGRQKSSKGYTASYMTPEEEDLYNPLLQDVFYIKINS